MLYDFIAVSKKNPKQEGATIKPTRLLLANRIASFFPSPATDYKILSTNIMKKVNLIIRFLICLFLITAIAGCAGSKRHESTGEYLDDSVLTSKVKATILGDSKLKVFQISVETFKGVVQLSGFVDSQEMVDRAVHLTRTIRGVKQVNNSLIVK